MAELSAKALNEQIVQMRKIVEMARVRLCRRLIRLSKRYEKSSDEKKKRKGARYMEEVKAAKQVHNDDITKFALINSKSLKELPLKGSTPAAERVFFKLAVENAVTDAVNIFRKEYPGWKHEVPFILQRLGMQYHAKKYEGNKASNEAMLRNFISDAEPATSTEAEDKKPGKKRETTKADKAKKTGKVTKKRNSATEMSQDAKEIVDFVKQEVAKAVHKLPKKVKQQEKLKKKAKQKEKSAKDVIAITKLPEILTDIPVIIKGQGVIKKLNLKEDNEEDVVGQPVLSKAGKVADYAPSSSFFVPLGQSRGIATGAEELADHEPRGKRKIADFDFSRISNEDDESTVKHAERTKGVKRLKKSSKPLDSTLEEAESLHPSWAAKKRQRELAAQLRKAPPPKKTVFDDDE